MLASESGSYSTATNARESYQPDGLDIALVKVLLADKAHQTLVPGIL